MTTHDRADDEVLDAALERWGSGFRFDVEPDPDGGGFVASIRVPGVASMFARGATYQDALSRLSDLVRLT